MSQNPAESVVGRSDPSAQFVPTGVGMTGTSWTLQLDFTRALVVGSVPTDRPLATIILSWPLAKILMMQLGNAVEQYEKLLGAPVQLPPQEPSR